MDDLRLPLALTLAALTLGPAPARSRPADWPPPFDVQVRRDDVRLQATRTMTLDLPGPANAVFAMFGPLGEKIWSPGWNPTFITPSPDAQTPDGAVFTTGGPDDVAVWVMTDFDPVQRIVRYVHVRPGKIAAQLWISVDAVSERRSRADVTFRYTRLGPAGDVAMQHFLDNFPHYKEHWEQFIGQALRGK